MSPRIALVLMLAACGGPQRHAPEGGEGAMPTGSFFTDKGGPAADRRFREGPGGFPLPADAVSCQDMPNKDLTCKVPRKRDVVHDELVEHIKGRGMIVMYGGGGGGVTAAKQELAGGYRMHIESPSAHYLVSVTTDTEKTSLLTITVK
jgi:hypothetical protein